MLRRTRTGRERGQYARALVLVSTLLVAGCATQPKGEVAIRPSVQRQATHQVVGDAVIASLGGVAVTVRWLSAAGVQEFYNSKPGLVYPWPQEVWKEAPPIVFFLRFRNQTADEVQFDPVLAALVAPDGRRQRPIPYEEMYLRMGGAEVSGPRLRTLQATLFSRFVVIPPGGDREGLLVFPTLDSDSRHLLLELSSVFVGGRSIPGFFEFQVLREKTD